MSGAGAQAAAVANLEIKLGSQSEKYGNPYPVKKFQQEIHLGETLEFVGQFKKYLFRATAITAEEMTLTTESKDLQYWHFDAGKVDHPKKLPSSQQMFHLKLQEALLASEVMAEFEGRKEIVIRLIAIRLK